MFCFRMKLLWQVVADLMRDLVYEVLLYCVVVCVMERVSKEVGFV